MILRVLQEKKQSLRRLEAEEKKIQQEIQEIEQKKKNLEKTTSQLKNLEQDYDSLKLEVQELARHEETDVGMEITMKQRELDRMRLIIKQSSREKSELEQEIEEISKDLEEKEGGAEEKEKQQQVLQEKYRKKLQDKTRLQDRIRLFESDMLKKQNDERLIENEINNFKIKIAEINAQIEGINEEAREFQGVEIIKASVEILQDKLQKTQQILATIGTVNLRALEVYDDIKKQYDSVAEKVEQLNKEKQEILKIVEEIDKKKKKVFHKTLEEINALFSRNFSQLSSKGEAFLEPENQEDTFAAGLDIIIKVARGKYFDVTSLSGGEQTLIALALIFAIQEYRPYSFYIFDEIDAALDKANSELLTNLLKKYMKSGQYIVITHNDAIITNSNVLYGVSMHEGVSKILSLKYLIGRKKPEVSELKIGGKDLEEKSAFLNSLLDKEIKINDVFKENQYVDIHAVTKGKGLQGPVKRFGVSLRQHKAEKGTRRVGSLGNWMAKTWRVAHPGQMGFFKRTEHNKLIFKIGKDDIATKEGFHKYGKIKNDYVILKGSIAGPKKRVIVMTEPIRDKKIYQANIISIKK